MTQINVSFKTDSFKKGLLAAAKNQIPFATSLAINKTAGEARDALKKHAKNVFTLRNRHIERGIRMQASNKKNLTAVVGSVDRIVEEQARGGIKTDRRATVPGEGVRPTFPTKVPRSKFPQRLLQKGGKRKPFFVTFKSGRKALVQRTGTKRLPLKVLYHFPSRVLVKARFRFERIVQAIVKGRFNKNVEAALDKALKTAR